MTRSQSAFALFVAVAIGTGFVPAQTRLSPTVAKTVLFASVGPEFIQYDLDVAQATLTKRTTLTLPANVQEAVLHPSRKHLYISWSNTGASYGNATPRAAAIMA